MTKKTPITPTEYDKLISKVIHKGRNCPVHEVMIEMLETASKYVIVEDTCSEKS